MLVDKLTLVLPFTPDLEEQENAAKCEKETDEQAAKRLQQEVYCPSIVTNAYITFGLCCWLYMELSC